MNSETSKAPSPPCDASATQPRCALSHARAAADFGLMLLLALVAAAGCWRGSQGLDQRLVGSVHCGWFDADCQRAVDNVTNPQSAQYRAPVHPLYALLIYPIVSAVRWAGLAGPVLAVRLVRALAAAGSAALFYLLVRVLTGRRLDSVVFTLLAGASAAAQAWFIVPETYPLGLPTILFALTVAAVGGRRSVGPAWDVFAVLATLSMTITNGIVGLATTFARHSVRRAVGLTVVGVCILLGLMAIQQQVFPTALPYPWAPGERSFLLPSDAGGPARVTVAFVSHAVVMPAIGTVWLAGDAGPMLSVQHAWPGSSGADRPGCHRAVGGAAHSGADWSGGRPRAQTAAAGARAVAAGAARAAPVVWSETFLYACHYGPLLVLAAAWSVRTRLRRLALLLALVAIPLVALNNARQLQGAITLLRDDGSLPASRATDVPVSPSRATIGQQFCQSEPP